MDALPRGGASTGGWLSCGGGVQVQKSYGNPGCGRSGRGRRGRRAAALWRLCRWRRLPRGAAAVTGRAWRPGEYDTLTGFASILSGTPAMAAERADRSLPDAAAEHASRARRRNAVHKPHRSRRPYLFKSLIYCAICQRRMQGQHSHGIAHYRCRFPQEYALANKIQHPRNVIMREEALILPLDRWLSQAFSPTRREHTIAVPRRTRRHRLARPDPRDRRQHHHAIRRQDRTLPSRP